MSADLVLVNLSVLLAGRTEAPPGLIAIRGNRIIHVGSADGLGDVAGAATRVVDCGGGLVVPGFNDAHCHPLAHAAGLGHVDCLALPDIAAIQHALRERAAVTGGDGWVRAANGDPGLLAEGRLPSRSDLDAAVADRPVVLVERSGQSCVLNSLALVRCGLAGLGDGVVAGSDPHVARAIPPVSAQELEDGVRRVGRLYLERGITSLHDTSWSNGPRHWQAWRRLVAEGVLPQRVTMLAGFDALDDFKAAGLVGGAGDERLRLGAMKIALDESSEDANPPAGEIEAAALAAHLGGFALSFHAPDARLLAAALGAVETVRGLGGWGARPPPRFEHCPVCPPHLIAAMAAAGVSAVVQPGLLAMTGPAYLDRTPAEALGWISPFHSLLAAGVGVAFGSDAPLTACSPLDSIAIAVSRKVADGRVLGPDEALGPADALLCQSLGGAACAGEDRTKGRIAPGFLADLAVLDRNPLTDGPDALAAARVRMTILDGKMAWAA